MVPLKIRFRGFETRTRSRTLPVPTADDTTIHQTAWALFEAEAWTSKRGAAARRRARAVAMP